MSYYMPSPRPSHLPPPVMYTSSHHSGAGYLPPQPPYDPGYGGYPQPYVVSTTPSSRSHGHRSHRQSGHYHDHRSQSRHGHGRSHSRHHHHRRHRSLGERILRWFGIGRHRSHHRNPKGFFGNSRYVDSRSGMDVDYRGRAMYTV